MKRKSEKKISFGPLIFTSTLGLGLGFGTAYYLHSLKSQEIVPKPVVSTTKVQSKEQIIQEILVLTGIDKIVFSRTAIPHIRNELLAKNPESYTLNQENFWNDFQLEEESKIRQIDADYRKLSFSFYDQFTREELEKYISLKKLPISRKVEQLLIEGIHDAGRDQEKFRQFTKLIKDQVAKIRPPASSEKSESQVN